MKSSKVILVLIDGLAWHVAEHAMGYLHALRENNQASVFKLQCELPSLSRPLYECILTGSKPVVSGIRNNQTVQLSTRESIFHLARKANLKTAAAAYHWISELYNRAPYDAVRDRFTHNESLAIQHGIFYHEDSYPDSHLLLDAEHLRNTYDPDFLFIHTMNVDDMGHRSGGDSAAYRNAARRVDTMLSHYLPAWQEQGYRVIITSDHGMNNDHSHGGLLPEEREVPLFLAGPGFNHQPNSFRLQQVLIRDLCALALGIPVNQNNELKSFLA
ncbi:MAG: alkaline phosphatase family protein [Alcaligenaceae bacterium]|nr:alkaline phosphatase family protein [Alcaligenaceae bacterium]